MKLDNSTPLILVAIFSFIGFGITRVASHFVPKAHRLITAEPIVSVSDELGGIRPGASPNDVAEVLNRLAYTHSPFGRSVALARVADPSPIVREAVAGALNGLDDPQSLDALRKLRRDPASPVRSRAKEALGYRLSQAPNQDN